MEHVLVGGGRAPPTIGSLHSSLDKMNQVCKSWHRALLHPLNLWERKVNISLFSFNQDFSNNANKHVHSYLNKLHIGILMVLENSAYKVWSQKFLFYYSSMENKIQLIWWHVLYFVFSLHYWFMLSCNMLLF